MICFQRQETYVYESFGRQKEFESTQERLWHCDWFWTVLLIRNFVVSSSFQISLIASTSTSTSIGNPTESSSTHVTGYIYLPILKSSFSLKGDSSCIYLIFEACNVKPSFFLPMNEQRRCCSGQSDVPTKWNRSINSFSINVPFTILLIRDPATW